MRHSEKIEWKAYLSLMKERPESFAESDLVPIVTDPDLVDRFVEKTGKKIGVLYQSAYHIMVVDLIRKSDTDFYTYERLLPTVKNGAVVIIPVLDGKFVLLKQYRHAIRDFQYGFPRGFGEAGISASENAKKELAEEIGAEVIRSEYLGELTPDSGIADKKADVYMCHIAEIEKKCGYEGIADVVMLSQKEIEQWIEKKRITDAFTLAAYSLYRFRGEIESSDC